MDFFQLIFRKAEEKDLSQIITMLSDDILGKNREDVQNDKIYHQAFLDISASINDYLMVIEFEHKIIATCHLTLMPSLSIKASKRMNIESVRVSVQYRGVGIGSWMYEQALAFAKDNHVKIIQLATNTKRQEARKFYESLGFVASHEGMKFILEDN